MHGPDILCRSLSEATTGSGGKPFAFGNVWQYHSRSDRHSKLACWGLTLDLFIHCSLLRRHVEDGKVGFGINHELRDYRNNKKKNLDLVLCRLTARGPSNPTRKSSRSSVDFAGLALDYGIALASTERASLAALPSLKRAGVSTVLVATEAKAAMTAFSKAAPRLKDELTSSHQTVHGDTEAAIAAGLVLVNGASTFVSSSRNKFALSGAQAIVSVHRQPSDANKIIAALRDIQRRSSVVDSGFDAMGVVVVDCKNDGSAIRRIDSFPPAPAPNDDFDYERFVHRLAHLYTSRFAEL